MTLHKDVIKHAARSNWCAGVVKPILSESVFKGTYQMTRVANFAASAVRIAPAQAVFRTVL